MKKAKFIYQIFGIPATIYHELSHIIMIFIVRAKLTAFTMTVGCKMVESFTLNACVYHIAKYRIQSTLISIAPLITWIAMYIFSVWNHLYIIGIYFCFYMPSFFPSATDWGNVKHHLFGIGKNYTTSEEDLEHNIKEINQINASSKK